MARCRAFAICVAALGAAVICLAPAAAFAQQPDDSHPAAELRFTYWASHTENQFLVRVCESFEAANPGVKVKREWLVGDYGRKLQLLFITGKAGDVLLMDDEFLPTYGVRGYLEDLRPYILRESDATERALAAELRYMETPPDQRDPAFEREYLPTALQSFNYRGSQGGLPWGGNAALIFYNKDLFDAAGVPYPARDWTWAQFREIARALTRDTDGDGHTDQFGTTMSFGFLGFETLLWCFGGEVLNADQTRCLMNDERGLEAAQFLYDMKYQDHSIAWTGQLEGFNVEVQLLTGKVGMVLAMSYMIPALNRVDDVMRWGLAHIPAGPRGDRYSRVTWDGISIYAHAPPAEKELAWRFIKHLLNDDNQAALGDCQRGLPVRRKQALEHYIKPETPAEEEIALATMEYGKLTPITPRYQEMLETMSSELDRLENAQASGVRPKEALDLLVQKVDQVLRKELADWSARMTPGPPREAAGVSSVKALGVAAAILAGALSALLLVSPIRRSVSRQWDEVRHMARSRRARFEGLEGLAFAAPWLVGLCVFTAFPILFSIVLSFSQWDPYEPLDKVQFVGLANYLRAFSQDPVEGDPLVLTALYNTFYYAVFAVPLGLCVSLGLAVLLNQKIRGITLFRTAFYLPSIVSGVATVVLWTYIFNPTFGPLNAALRGMNRFFDWTVLLAFINLPEPKWLGDPQWAKPAMILMSLWGAGGAGMLIFLAGLQGVPDQLYEVAELDGAGRWRQFWNITLPMLTPTIYFNLVMGIIGALKIFMQAYILTDGKGGVERSLLFYVLHLYTKAFVEYEMGYASALAWLLFLIILGLTLLVIRSSSVWVYYEGEQKG